MDKESLILLQKLDCNCNDCIYMVRDLERFEKSVAFHRQLCLNEFEMIKHNLLKSALEWDMKSEPNKANVLRREAERMKFQFNKKIECPINYGNCSRFNKPVSFIPGILQLETQECFNHRRDAA